MDSVQNVLQQPLVNSGLIGVGGDCSIGSSQAARDEGIEDRLAR